MPNMVCNYCRREYPADYKWCMDDGSELEQNLGQYEEAGEEGTKVPCPECGEPVDTRDLFCGSCAAKLEGLLPQPEPDYEDTTEYEEPETYQEPAPVPDAAPVDDGPKRPCPKCGDDVGMGDTFCGSCGAELESAIPSVDFAALTQGRVCPRCAAGLEPTDTFCGACGHSVEPEVAPAPAEMCPSCGMELVPGDVFCGTCGNPVQRAEPGDQPAPAQAAPAPAPQQQPGVSVMCPSCGMEVAPGDTFCGTCGTPIQQKHREAAAKQQAPSAPAGDTLSSCPSCGMDAAPGETFCGTCGHPLQEQAEAPVEMSAPDAAAPAAPELSESVPAAPVMDTGDSHAGGASTSCPNCGMDIAPGEDFCGTCGHSLGTAASLQPADDVEIAPELSAPPEEPPAIVFEEEPVMVFDEKITAASCPNCGMETSPGEINCSTCGHSLSGEAPAVVLEEEAPPLVKEPVFALQDEQPQAGGFPPAAEPVAFCPNCGLDIHPGETMCSSCGYSVSGQSEPSPSPGGFDMPASEPPAAPAYTSISDVTANIPVCPACGIEGAPGQTSCFACGTALTTEGVLDPGLPGSGIEEPAWGDAPAEPAADSSAADWGSAVSFDEPAPAAPETSAASSVMPAPSPADFSAEGKICSCCGSANSVESEFCSNCGVDFD